MPDKKLYLTAITLILAIFLPLITSLSGEFQILRVLAQTSANRKAEAEKVMQQGREQFQISQFDAALESWQKALIIYREIQDREGEVKVLNNIGLAHQKKGDYASAINALQQSFSIAEAIKYPLGKARTLGNLGLVFQDRGDYAQAIYYHQQNLAIAKEIQDLQSEAKALGNLGLVYYFLGDSPTAIKKYWEASAIFQKIPEPYSQTTLLNNLGLAYSSIGDYATAIKNYQQALTIAQKITDIQIEAKILGNLGTIYYLLGDFPKAIDSQQKWLAIARKIGDIQSEGNALGNLGLTYYGLEDYPKAIDYQQQSLAIARKIQDRLGEGQSLNNLGLAFYKSGNVPAAEKSLYQAIDIWEDLRNPKIKLQDTEKVSLFDTQTSTYTVLQQVLIAQNKTDVALQISERGRARAFVELILTRLSNNKNEVNPTKSLTIAQLKQIANTQNSTLVQYSLIREELRVAKKLQLQESELYIWVIKPTGEVTFRKIDLKPLWQKQNTSLKDLITTTRTSLGIDDKSRSLFDVKIVNPVDEKIQKQSLQTLHKLLIQPIADLLPTDPNQRVVFVPQSDLFLVPFPALLDEKDKYLIEKHTILTSPSIQVLELTRQQRNKVKQASVSEAVVVGNPTMPNFAPKIGEKPQKLATLPGAKREAEAIAPILNTKALTGDAATETAIKAKLPQARIIHLATHGLFDDFQGLQSAIALAPSNQDDGLLTAEEILSLKLNADLVILSACNTGRGRITGDGVIGLSRSLFIAGTPSVIVSLWSVPDSPTAKLMTEFYTNLNQNKLNKAQALRQAMLKIKQQYPNKPLNWAAFTLIGEAE